ncbi:MAG: DEAD/DEAH box helicase [Desulfobacterales bacterium]|jgi:ATP-dependent RNA helicase RhlE|nr:DEAD/DEAH box helicase [Desulfobacterales bacterium]
MSNFDRFRFNPTIMAGVQALGYTTPTPIQLEAIPPILEGKDVMGLAQTGTGKTAAFVLPILQRLMPSRRGGVRALVIAPTRELTEQTLQATRQMGRKTGLSCVSIYGGASMQAQVDCLRRGADIVSACPGRLLDHLRRKTINLSKVEVLVLDEADQMFDMGFLPDIRAILKHLPADRQTLLFSATMPAEINTLASDILRSPVRVQIGRPAPAETVSHTFCPVETNAKNSMLDHILKTAATGLVLVFTRTKQRSKRVAQQLEASGYEAAALHGNLSQNNRQKAIQGFRAGRYKILVATDIAARGIDVCGVSHVINYDIPATADAYTHRIGRTGRACATGEAITFVSSEERGLAREIGNLIGGTLKLEANRMPAAARPEPAPRLPGAGTRSFGAYRRPDGRRNPTRFRKASPLRRDG